MCLSVKKQVSATNSLNELNVGHLNIFHLHNKVTDLCAFFQTQSQYHIFGVTESRLTRNVSDNLVNIPNYQILRKDSANKREKRKKKIKGDSATCKPTGIAVYIHNSIKKQVTRRHELEPDNIEVIWLEVKSNLSSPILIGFLYRNPAVNDVWINDFENMMDSVSMTRQDIYILGDFNIDLMKMKKRQWHSVKSLYGLTQMVKKPTRTTRNSTTLIDHIYTSNCQSVNNVSILDVGISDHCVIRCNIRVSVKKSTNNGHTHILYRSFKHFDKELFLRDIRCTPFQNVFSFTDPEKAMSWWINVFTNILDKHAPIKKKRVRKSSIPPWLNNDIKQAMKKRNALKKEKKFEEYKKQRNHIKVLIRQAKKQYFNTLVSDQKDIPALWRAINAFSKENLETKEIPRNLTSDHFNQHFLSIAESLTQGLFEDSNKFECSEQLKEFCSRQLNSKSNVSLFSIPYISVTEVIDLILNIKNSKASGHDAINSNFLKMSVPFIAESLTYIYNLCIQQNIFPQSLKIGKVTPIPKTKELSDVNNFRPISVLSILSKPLERHVHKHLSNFLESSNLLLDSQSGFRTNHSCQTALTEIIDRWLLSINKSKVNGSVFLDFKKAFDLVNHNIILKKLKEYGLSQSCLSFFESYLKDRKQSVNINGSLSYEGGILYGVPQGSILGPLLFSIFINDLPLSISDPNINCTLFADDATIDTSDKDVQVISERLQTCINEISGWCFSNHMILNPSKTKCMIITTRQKHQLKLPKLNLTVQSQPVEQVNTHRLLGVTIDEQLNWKPHIRTVCNKVSKNIFLLSKLKYYLNFESRKLFFHAHIKSHIDYASTLWDRCADVHLIRLNSLYRRATKHVMLESSVPTDSKLEQMHLLSLRKQLIFKKYVYMHKVLFGKTPQNIKLLFQRFKQSGKCSRNKTLRFPYPKIEIFKTSFSYSGAFIWNKLPATLHFCSSLSYFKTEILNFINTIRYEKDFYEY